MVSYKTGTENHVSLTTFFYADTEVDAETLDKMADEIVDLLVQEEEAENLGLVTTETNVDVDATSNPNYPYGNQVRAFQRLLFIHIF